MTRVTLAVVPTVLQTVVIMETIPPRQSTDLTFTYTPHPFHLLVFLGWSVNQQWLLIIPNVLIVSTPERKNSHVVTEGTDGQLLTVVEGFASSKHLHTKYILLLLVQPLPLSQYLSFKLL